MVIMWTTHKTEAGFEFRVIAVEHGKKTETLNSGVYPTRAKAKAAGQKWTKYYKQQAAA